MRFIGSLRKISGSMRYVTTPRSRSRPWIDGALTYARGSSLLSSKYEPRRDTAGPQRSIAVTCSNSSSHTKYAMFPCSCGVRAVCIVVSAAAVVDGNTVVASSSCAASPRRARSRRRAMNGVTPVAQKCSSCHQPRPPKGGRSRTTEVGFVVPGMINCHTHLVFDGTKDFDAEAHQSDTVATLKAVKNARESVRAGVTTVRDLGANGTMVVELGRAIEKGMLDGPRIVASARGITTTGGHGIEVGRICDGIDEIRKGIREQVHAGATVIKLFSTGGVLGGGARPRISQYTLQETRAAVDEAHKLGVKITTHAHGAEGMRVAAQAKIDSIEHCTMLDAQTIRAIKDNDVALVPTFCALHGIVDNAAVLPADGVERATQAAEKH